MKNISIFLASQVAILATAVSAARPGSFILGAYQIAKPGEDVIFDGDSINASGLKFWVNKDTTTYCPNIPQLDCTGLDSNETLLSLSDFTTTMGMDVNVPGGQQVYIAPDGRMSFTQAHSAYIPPGSAIYGFTRDTTSSGQTILNNEFRNWHLCPNSRIGAPEDRAYQLYAFSNGVAPLPDCIAIEIHTTEPLDQSGGVWQYI
ncbi:hypothetical protein GGR50DRAFT_513675 [Xylaria sp. CBS 124048]|nr:hypothetical protein GGR50DRAFT_513675 [Xylaria sp. CBS 124048]